MTGNDNDNDCNLLSATEVVSPKIKKEQISPFLSLLMLLFACLVLAGVLARSYALGKPALMLSPGGWLRPPSWLQYSHTLAMLVIRRTASMVFVTLPDTGN